MVNQKLQAITLLGDTLYQNPPSEGPTFEQYLSAKSAWERHQDNPDSLIWFGRRSAYLGLFREAIDLYTDGIIKFPDDPRFYRHRGHRYISTRQYDQALQDLEHAIEIIQNQPDQIEPDGLPNDRNISLSTLHSNIWYHYGLAHYLKGNLNQALTAYSKRIVTDRYDDNLVSGAYWNYMIQRRMGKSHKEVYAVIKDVHRDLDIIENHSYFDMCLFFNGQKEESELANGEVATAQNDVYNYALGNWYLFHHQDTVKAQKYWKELLVNGNPFSFAYLAAESDWVRLGLSQKDL